MVSSVYCTIHGTSCHTTTSSNSASMTTSHHIHQTPRNLQHLTHRHVSYNIIFNPFHIVPFYINKEIHNYVMCHIRKKRANTRKIVRRLSVLFSRSWLSFLSFSATFPGMPNSQVFSWRGDYRGEVSTHIYMVQPYLYIILKCIIFMYQPIHIYLYSLCLYIKRVVYI